MSEQAGAKAGFVGALTGLQKLTLALAAAIMVGGAGLWAYAAAASPDRTAQIEQAPPGEDLPPGYSPQGFADGATAGEPTEGAEAAEAPLELYTPALFRLGLAFFVGFAIAYAIRAALKVVLVVVGVVLLLLVGLQMAGFITVNWGAMDGAYQSVTAWLGEQTQSLTAFLRGYIPSGGTAVAGFGVGLLKKH